MKNTMRLICTSAGVACSAPPIEGRAGRYMSIANGPTAVIRPSTMARRIKRRVMIKGSEQEEGVGGSAWADSILRQGAGRGGRLRLPYVYYALKIDPGSHRPHHSR